MDGPFLVVRCSSVGVDARVSESVAVSAAVPVADLLADGAPSEITRCPIAAVTSGVIGVMICVVVSQAEDRVAYREAFLKWQCAQETKRMGGC